MRAIRRTMGRLRLKLDEAQENDRDAQTKAKPPRFAPAGQSTQMIIGADARQRPDHPRHQRQSLRRLPAQARLLLGLQPDPRRQPRAAAAPPPLHARAPALSGRLADALLRL